MENTIPRVNARVDFSKLRELVPEKHIPSLLRRIQETNSVYTRAMAETQKTKSAVRERINAPETFESDALFKEENEKIDSLYKEYHKTAKGIISEEMGPNLKAGWLRRLGVVIAVPALLLACGSLAAAVITSGITKIQRLEALGVTAVSMIVMAVGIALYVYNDLKTRAFDMLHLDS